MIQVHIENDTATITTDDSQAENTFLQEALEREGMFAWGQAFDRVRRNDEGLFVLEITLSNYSEALILADVMTTAGLDSDYAVFSEMSDQISDYAESRTDAPKREYRPKPVTKRRKES